MSADLISYPGLLRLDFISQPWRNFCRPTCMMKSWRMEINLALFSDKASVFSPCLNSLLQGYCLNCTPDIQLRGKALVYIAGLFKIL